MKLYVVQYEDNGGVWETAHDLDGEICVYQNEEHARSVFAWMQNGCAEGTLRVVEFEQTQTLYLS